MSRQIQQKCSALLFGCSLSALVAATGGGAWAQGATLALEEIIVTATKRAVGLQDVGIAVSALSNETIERQGFVGVGDYLTKLPSVTIQDRGPGRNQIVIRGVASTAGGQADNTVGVYIGDVPLSPGLAFGANGYPDLKLYDVDRIEVLRGPQGTLYGSGSLGGTVKVVPRDPVLGEVEILADAGTSHTRHGSWNMDLGAAVNLPLAGDKAALRVSAYYYDQSGFIDNRFDGLDYSQPLDALGGLSMNDVGVPDPDIGPRNINNVNDVETVGVRAALRVAPTDELDIVLSYLHQDADADGLPERDHTSPAYTQARLFDETLGDKFDFANLVINYDFGAVQATSSTGWMKREIFQNRDVSAAFFTAPIRLLDLNKTELWSEELRLSSANDGRFQWIVGGFYQHIKGNGIQDADWMGNAASMTAFFENLVLGVPIGADDELYERDDVLKQRQIAFFGELSYDITDSLRAIVGGRWYEYKQTMNGYEDGLFTGGTPVGGAPSVIRNLTSKEDGFNPKVALELRPADGQLYYAQVAKGFRLGGTQAGVPDAAPGCAAELAQMGLTPAETRDPIKSDSIWAYELGAKTTLADGRVTLNGALFYIDWKDIPVTFLLQCAFSYAANAGKASSKGAELELTALLAEGLTANIGGSYTKAVLEEDTPLETGLGGLKGDRLPGIPKWNIQAGLQYEFEIGGRAAFGRSDFHYVSGFLNKFPGDTGVIGQSGDYFTLNLRAGLAITENLMAEVYAQNVTDESINLILDTEFADGRTTLGRPRTLGAVLRLRY